MNRYKALSVALGAAAIVGLMAAPAGAVPKKGDALTLECDALGSVDILTNSGNGLWTPGFVVGNNQRLIPYAFKFDFGGDVFEASKPAPRNGRLDRCEFTIEDPEGTVNGIVWLSYT